METLLERAREALSNSYAPYSDYQVGAALRTLDGTVYTGCNIENANYSNSLHAEEVALGKAISDGHREFDRLAVTSLARDGVTPCGMCRQTLAEFCPEEFEIVCEGAGTDGDGNQADTEGDETGDRDARPKIYHLGDLLPETITREHLETHND